MLCHKEVRKIARGIAAAAYEDLARDDVFYKAYPDQKKFVERHWKNFIGAARKSLVQMLGENYPEHIKEHVFDVYVQDRTLQAVDDLQVQGTA